jgi:nucleoside-diphosphate-sugar epimerase
MIAGVTGAKGLIGNYIVLNLLKLGWDVSILTRNEENMVQHPQVKIVVGDINDKKIMRDFLAGVTAVFHCAAELHDNSKMYDVNVSGTKTLLCMLKNSSHVDYFCHLSSAGVLGPTSKLLIDESSACAPNNIYEKTKFEAEQLILAADLPMSVCILRPGNVFDANKPGLIKLAFRGSLRNRLYLFFSGNEGAHLVHAKDVASAAIFFQKKQLENPEIFFVTYDDDDRNTVAGVYAYTRSLLTGIESDVVLALPKIIPHLVRKIRFGRSLHGRSRFSEKKLHSFGFTFPLGFEPALKEVYEKNTGLHK